MQSLDAMFLKEFRETMRYRRANTEMVLSDIPVPEGLQSNLPRRKIAIARGITDEKYKVLNFDKTDKTKLSLVGRQKTEQTIYTSDGKPRVDTDGNIKTRDYTVPRDSLAVISEIPISSLYKSKEGFDFIDRVEGQNGKRKFMYLVPKKYLYEVNMCALVIRLDKLRNSYTAIQVTLTNGHKVYIHVVPFKPTKALNQGSKYIKVKPSANFDKEIMELLNYWQLVGVMFNREYTAFSEPVNGVSDCALEQYDTTLDTFMLYDRNKPLDKSTDEDDLESDW